jgi:hypothetical protein
MLSKEWDVTQMQMAAAIRANIKTKNQRRVTVVKGGRGDRMEETMEKIGRKVMQSLLLRKSTTKEAKELEYKVRQAEFARMQAFDDGSGESFSVEGDTQDELDDDDTPLEDDSTYAGGESLMSERTAIAKENTPEIIDGEKPKEAMWFL